MYAVRNVLDAFFITYSTHDGKLMTDDKDIFKKFIGYAPVTQQQSDVGIPSADADSVLPYQCRLGSSQGHPSVLRDADLPPNGRHPSGLCSLDLTKIFYLLPYSIELNKYRKLLETLLCNLISVFSLAHMVACLWIRNNEFLSNSPMEDYNDAIYFLFTTASTIGYGDLTVDHQSLTNVSGRYLFATSLMIFALIFFAYVLSLIYGLLQKLQAVDQKVREKVEEFEDWMAVRNMTPGVIIHYRYEMNLKKFFDYLHKFDVFSAIGADGYLEQMHHSHKEQIHSSATEYVAASFSFFEELSPTTKQNLILGLTPIWYGLSD